MPVSHVAGADRVRALQRPVEVRDDRHRIAERLERLEDRAELEAGAGRRRRPVAGPLAHRHEDGAEAPRRRRRRLRSAVSAGTIASSNGSARVAPSPRSTVRRDNDVLVMNIDSLLYRMSDAALMAAGSVAGALTRIWNGALRDDPEDDRREPVVVALARRATIARTAGMSDAGQAAAERIGQQLLGHRPDEGLGLAQQRLPQLDDAVDLGAVDQLARGVDRRRRACRRRACARRRRRRSSRAPGRPDPSSGDSSAHAGLRRCCFEPLAHRPRLVAPRSPPRTAARRRAAAAAATPSTFSRIHLPRSTGEVRCACEVTIRMAPLPSRPRRASSVSVTRRKWLP